jgi:hypothetical protein
MAFQTPIGVPLTETQERVLAQLGSLKGFLSIPDKRNKTLDKDRQISTFDYLLRLTESTIGASFIDVMLKEFISRLFDPNNDKLETFIIKSMEASLAKNNKKISNTQSNAEWLNQNVLPELKLTFRVAKALIAKQIIIMIFGPKQKMDSDPIKQNAYLDYASCADTMLSVSNDSSETDGDIESNLVELKKRLEKGEVEFTISCQDIKIKLPENIDSTFDAVIQNNQNPSRPPQNPAIFFDVISNHVGAETQRINSPSNSNSVKKGFLQILVEKIINLITPVIDPYVAFAIKKINSGPNGDLGVTSQNMLSNPCDLRELCGSDEVEFEKKSAFTSKISNLIFAMVCSIMLQKLIKEIKKLIANAFAKKAKAKIQRKVEKQKQRFEILENAQEAADAVAKSRAALGSLDDIFNFDKIA